jgi:hypothetical protein
MAKVVDLPTRMGDVITGLLPATVLLEDVVSSLDLAPLMALRFTQRVCRGVEIDADPNGTRLTQVIPWK